MSLGSLPRFLAFWSRQCGSTEVAPSLVGSLSKFYWRSSSGFEMWDVFLLHTTRNQTMASSLHIFKERNEAMWVCTCSAKQFLCKTKLTLNPFYFCCILFRAFHYSAVPVYILISTLFIFQVRPSGVFESKIMNELLMLLDGRYFSCVDDEKRGQFLYRRIFEDLKEESQVFQTNCLQTTTLDMFRGKCMYLHIRWE